ncbi:DMT family transporter, partial [Nonlabens mediterrranea]|nr:DMT family transporter [Nonlabens mediterrranea]
CGPTKSNCGNAELTSDDWLWMGILASVCTAYAFIASVKVMKYLSAYTVMLTTNLEPVYGILLAFFILGDAEQMTPQFYIGAVVILVVIVLNGFIKTRLQRK